MESMLIKFKCNTRLEAIANALENRISPESDYDEFKKGAEINKLRFNKHKCKVAHIGRDN